MKFVYTFRKSVSTVHHIHCVCVCVDARVCVNLSNVTTYFLLDFLFQISILYMWNWYKGSSANINDDHEIQEMKKGHASNWLKIPSHTTNITWTLEHALMMNHMQVWLGVKKNPKQARLGSWVKSWDKFFRTPGRQDEP